MDNEAIAQNLEALMKQVAMLQSYTELKNGQDFKNYCQQWTESDNGTQGQNNLSSANSANVGVKRKVADSQFDNEVPGTSNSSLGLQSQDTVSNKKTRMDDPEAEYSASLDLVRYDPHRHCEHGISYKLSGKGEKLFYKSHVYSQLHIKGQQIWRCAHRKGKSRRCPAKLVQAPNGSVISVEEHVHSNRNVKKADLNIESALRICSKSEVEDSDESGDESENVDNQKSSNNLRNRGMEVELAKTGEELQPRIPTGSEVGKSVYNCNVTQNPEKNTDLQTENATVLREDGNGNFNENRDADIKIKSEPVDVKIKKQSAE